MKTKILIAIVIALGIFLIWYLTPRQYTATLDGVYYQLDKEEVIENVKLHFEGKLQNRMNGKKNFNGVINFEGMKIPHLPQYRTELILQYQGDNFSTIFSGFRVIDEKGRVVPDIYTYGGIYINDDFTQFTITVFIDGDSQTWSSSDGLMITAPAKDRVEASNLSRKLMSRLGITLNN